MTDGYTWGAAGIHEAKIATNPRLGGGALPESSAMSATTAEDQPGHRAGRASATDDRPPADSCPILLWQWDLERDEIGLRNLSQFAEPRNRSCPGRFPGWSALVHEQDLPRVRERLSAHLDGRVPIYRSEHRLPPGSGPQRWVLDCGQVVRRAAGGRPLQMAGVRLEITESKEVERTLRESERRLRTMIDAVPDFICFKDPEGRWLEANEYGLRMFDLQDKDYRGKTDVELATLSPSYREALLTCRETDQKAWEAGRPRRGDEVVAGADGRTYVYDVIKVPTYHPDGSRRGLVVFGRDVTERRKSEQQRRELETKMQHAQKLESLGLLAGGIAHDFNNLLVGILGNAELALDETAASSPLRDYLQGIQQAAHRAAELTSQMLAYSGKARFVTEPVDLNALVREMAHLLEIAISKKVTIHYDFQPDLPPVSADPTQLRQVIMNLITNASEALGDRAGAIRISTGVRTCDRAYLSRACVGEALPPGQYVFTEVADTGCGMDAETKARIFDPFFTTKFTGRGLGLAAVLGIMRGHGGALLVESAPGKGSSFCLLLPPTARDPRHPAAPTTDVARSTGLRTILVVDDEPGVRSVVRATLEHAGYRVLTAGDGDEALRVFRDHADEIACVLLDLTMPQKSGNEVMAELQALRADIPIVLTSGYDETDVVNRFGKQALAGFVQKPYRGRDLLAAIDAALG